MDTNEFQWLVVPAVSLVAAAVTAFVTVYLSRRSMRREAALKFADYRHKWINDLRELMAEFRSIEHAPLKPPEKREKHLRLGAKIELMMNPNDEHFEDLQSAIHFYIYSPASTDDKQGRENSAEYITICQTILKTEWEVLKGDVKAELGVKERWP